MTRSVHLLAGVALVTGCSPAPPPDLLLITLDTMRADAIGAYGQAPTPTPTLDRLAANGLLVEESMAITPLTLPSHCSMLTGVSPAAHGVRQNLGASLPASADTVAERLHGAGWHTAAFVGAVVVDSVFGLDQGFDTYVDGFDLTARGEAGGSIARYPADQVVASAVSWIRGLADPRPAFVWVHLYDAHLPLSPPSPEREAFADPYLAAVAFEDAQIAALIDEMTAARGHPPVVLLVGDHGESRGDHGELQHGLFVYRSTMRVPMILSGPGVPIGRIAGPRSGVDVAPTLLALAGVAAPADLDGASLLGDGPPVVYGESFHGRTQYGLAELRVAEDDRYRYIRAPRPELYDWRADPGELRDLAGSQPEVEARLGAVIDRRAGAAPIGDRDPVDGALTGALASLGYVDGPSAVAVDVPYTDLPDPKDHADVVKAFDDLIVSARTRPPAEAAPLIEEFVSKYPGIGGARGLLSTAWQLAGDPTKARAAIAPLLTAQPSDPQLLARDGELLLAEGKPDEAEVELRRAIAAAPEWPGPYALLADIDRRRGDCPAAIAQAEVGLAKAPGSSQLRLVRGACRMSTGDLVGAQADLGAAVVTDPHNAEASFLLGVVLTKQGAFDAALPRLKAEVDRDPNDVTAQASVGIALYGLGRYDDARPILEAVVAGDVGYEPPMLLADIALRAGDVAAAERWLAEAERREPGAAAIHRVRASIRMANGDVDGALDEMTRANAR